MPVGLEIRKIEGKFRARLDFFIGRSRFLRLRLRRWGGGFAPGFHIGLVFRGKGIDRDGEFPPVQASHDGDCFSLNRLDLRLHHRSGLILEGTRRHRPRRREQQRQERKFPKKDGGALHANWELNLMTSSKAPVRLSRPGKVKNASAPDRGLKNHRK